MATALGACLLLHGQTSVLTRSYDNARTGSNQNEKKLTPANVAKQGLQSITLTPTGDDPRIEAQPLYVPALTMVDGKKHDVIFVSTMSNNVWAFDADTGAKIWETSLGQPFLPLKGDAVDVTGMNKSFGILSTPVIDPETGTLYAVEWDTNDPAHQNRALHLNALKISDGSLVPGKPALQVQASVQNAAGQTISFSQVQKQRAALLLTPLHGKPTAPAHKMLYVVSTGTEEPTPGGNPTTWLHGWVVAFDVDAWKQDGQWTPTPNSFGGGIWQGSQGPAADAAGNVYVITGNGGYVFNQAGQPVDVGIGVTDFPESFVRLTHTPGALTLKDWFTPFRDSIRKTWTNAEVAPFPKTFDYKDQDLGSAGPLLVPGSNVLAGAGKDGILYAMDRNNLGKFEVKTAQDFTKLKVPPAFFTYDPDQSVPAYQGATPEGNQDYQPMPGVKTHHLHGTPVYLKTTKGPLLFGWGENGTLRAYSIDATGKTQLVAHGAEFASADLASRTSATLGGMPGGMITASSLGTANGIVWATAPATGDANQVPVPGAFRAYDATSFGPADKNTDGVPRLKKIFELTGFTYSKFCPPVVADGRVIVPTYDGRVFVFTLKVAATPPVTPGALSLRISAGSNARAANEVEADYSTSHLFLDEVKGETAPVTVFFAPGVAGVQSAEVFTNLNRRAMATQVTGGIEEGINPPAGNTIAAGDDTHYYKGYAMTAVAGGFQITLTANKCGAYRLTARYRVAGDPAGTYRWYGKRDHALVVTPDKARAVRLYEANPLTINAVGTLPAQRGTLADLAGGLPASAAPRFSLAWLTNLGVNMVWLQPVHPRGIDGRQVDPTTGQPYELGSPYSVKSFFEVMPLMAKAFEPTGSPQTDDTPAGRAQALNEFRGFVAAADAAGVDVMLDAPFNHTAHDVELSATGQGYWGNAGSSSASEIRAVEARVFSRGGLYDMRASGAASVADAPDRFDFGKWTDVYDVYFGRYDALVPNTQPQNENDYRNEGDTFDYSVGNEQGEGAGNGHFDAITANAWRYFGDYLQFWLTTTNYPENASGAALANAAGIDGIRADFAQGLPPQCWEYIVNRTRTRKWDFVFMAESLDGGPVTYRSSRHFDVLNENLIYDLYNDVTTDDFRRSLTARRNSYGAGLTLLNTSSQDEDNYRNPFEALLRFAVNSTMPGVPMIFPGQELGLSGTINPGEGNHASGGQPFGYDRYIVDSPEFPKPIPSFMTYNSMMPLWLQLQAGTGNAAQLRDVYAAINQARASSAALTSGIPIDLNLKSNVPHEQIFSEARVERLNASPATSDVVFAFVNLTVGSDEGTQTGNWFNVNVDQDRNGVNDFGIVPGRLYNVKNIAAYAGVDAGRRDALLWPTPRTGADLLANGIFVHLNAVPVTAQGWTTAPWEAQYLRLVDVTPAGH